MPMNFNPLAKNVLLMAGIFSLFSFSAIAQEFRTGCILKPELYEKVPLAAPLMRGDYENLPSKNSLRKYAPIPQNQGAYGTCVGWSTAYAARTIQMAYQQNWTNTELITENAFSPFFVYEEAKPASDVFCQEGTSLFNALEILKDMGTVKISDFGMQCGQTITKTLERKATEFKVKDYRRLFDLGTKDKVPFVKKSIAENRPVVIGIQCCAESFLNAKGVESWKLQAQDNPNPDGGHALTVIGYDDNYHGEGKGAFELMNSWGTAWGDQGFIWMSYEDFNRYCFEAYEMSLPNTEINVLSGKIRFELSAGQEMSVYYKNGYYEMKEGYYSGTLFRVYITNNEPAYIYAFGSDLNHKDYKIFPNNVKVSPFLGYKGSKMAIPDEEHFIQMDDNKGIDYLCLLYSSEKLDFESILANLAEKQGTMLERLQAVLGDKMLQPKDANHVGKNEINFKGISRVKTVLPIVVAINHL
jgi:Papain family cysteine protease